MKKPCPVCEKTFSGRSDKLFCSPECKNQHHNSQRKKGVISLIDQYLHQNRAILQQLFADGSEKEIIERIVLERLGFQFDIITGLIPTPNGVTANRIYDFAWQVFSEDKIIVERLSLEVAAEY